MTCGLKTMVLCSRTLLLRTLKSRRTAWRQREASSHSLLHCNTHQDIRSICCCSVSHSGVSDSVIPWTAARQASLSFTISWSLIKLMSIESVMPSVIPFSSCLQSFPASGSYQMSPFFASGGQSIGVSASASILPMNIQD